MKKIMKRILSFFLAIVMTFLITLPAFAEEENIPETKTEQEAEYVGTNALGQVLSDAVNESDVIQPPEDETLTENYYIQDITIVENYYASAVISAPDNATLLVAIYDEETGEMITSSKTEVSSETETAEIVFPDGILSEFFVVKAFLVDAENNPLCKNFETMKYTQAFQEYISKTTEDFEEDKIINLDTSEDNNFAVVSDDAKVIVPTEETNILVTNDFENGLYVFENATEEITSLSEGDILYYVYGEGPEDYILDKISTIKKENGTVTITSTDDFKMSDLFRYIKIDTEQMQTEAPQTYAMARSGDEETGELDTTTKTFSYGFNLEFDVKPEEKVNFSGKMIVETTLQYYYDVELLGEDYYEVTCKIDTKLEGKVEIEIGEKKDFLPKAIFEDKIPITGGVKLIFKLKLKCEFEGKIKISGTFEYGTVSGCKKISGKVNEDLSENGEFKLKADIEGEAVFRIGPSISAELEIFKAITVGLEFSVVLEISAKVLYFDAESGMDVLYPDSRHECFKCVDGDVVIVGSVEFKIEIGYKRAKLKIAEIKYEFLREKLCDFYVSINSSYVIGFGLSECPNYRYKTTFKVVDNKNNPIQGVMISDGTTKYTTDSKGEAIGYYKNGTYSVTAVNGNYSIDTSRIKSLPIKFGIYSQPNTVNIYMIKNLVGDENGIADAGIAGDNITWTLSADGTLDIQGTGKMTDWMNLEKDVYNEPPWYEYASQIKKVNIASGITSIGGGAFIECVNLTEINIPDNVNYIGDSAFGGCENLVTVKLPSKLAEISDGLFSCCLQLKNITIPNGVTRIGYYAFGECYALENIAIPDKVTKIGEGAFAGCEALKYVSLGNRLKTIDDAAFEGCIKLTQIVIPDSVTSIGEMAFVMCENLINVTIGSGVKNVGNFAFLHCLCIENLIIKNGVESIGDYAFHNSCSNVTRLEIPGSVKKIGFGAFCGIGYNENAISQRAEVILNEGITSLGDYSFCYSAIKSINIPKTVVNIGEGAFHGGLLENITVDPANPLFSSDRYGVLYNKNKTTLIQYPVGNRMPVFEIPETVSRLKSYSFADLAVPLSISVPTSVKVIDDSAFGNIYEGYQYPKIYYKGSQAQWNGISIGVDNGVLITENIIFNSTPVLSMRSIAPITLDGELNTKSIDDAIEGNEYIIAVVRVSDAYDLLADYNLLYINQQTATGENMTFEYVVSDEETEYEVVVLGERLPHEHEYAATITNEPTCTENGFTVYKCECGDTYFDNKTEALGHDCGDDYICERCGLCFGDVNGDEHVDSNDAIHLLYHTLIPERYEINQDSDFDRDGNVNSNDAIYLLYHTLIPERYPLI